MSKKRRLGNITNKDITICCDGCGHKAHLVVTDLIAKAGKEAVLQEVISKLRCEECGQIGKVTYLITLIRGIGWRQ